jgi:hypothetical protein
MVCRHDTEARRAIPPDKESRAPDGTDRRQELFRFVALDRRQLTGDGTRYRRLYIPRFQPAGANALAPVANDTLMKSRISCSPQRDRSRIRLKRRGKIKAVQGRILEFRGSPRGHPALQTSRRRGIVSHLETTASTYRAVPDAVKLISFPLHGLGPEVRVDLHSDEERTKIVEIDHNLSHADIGQVA